MMDKDDLSKFEKNLISLLRIFQNRPHHLAKYFIQNKSFDKEFENNILNSKKLSELSNKYEFSEIPTIYFLNFKDMLKFFDNMSNEYSLDNQELEKTQEELNRKLDELIKSEKYEDAIKIRDYMIQNNIPRKN